MDLGPVDRITADAIGEPGARVFYIQARAGVDLVTVIVEKQQVQLLAASVLELLEDVPSAELVTEPGPGLPEPGVDESAMALEEPIDPRWRAGRLSIGFDQDRDLFLLEVEEFRPDPEDLEEDDPGSLLGADVGTEPESIRIWASPTQMLALSRHGAEVAATGPADVPVLRQPDRRGGPRVSRDERALEAGLSDPAVPRVLGTGELEVLGLLPNASNHTFLARAKSARRGTPRRLQAPPRRGAAVGLPGGHALRPRGGGVRRLAWPWAGRTSPPRSSGTARTGWDRCSGSSRTSRGALLHPRRAVPGGVPPRRRVRHGHQQRRPEGRALPARGGRTDLLGGSRGVLQRRAEAPDGDLGLHRRAARGGDQGRRAPSRRRGSAADRCATSSPTSSLRWSSGHWRTRADTVAAAVRFPEPGPDRRPYPWPPIWRLARHPLLWRTPPRPRWAVHDLPQRCRRRANDGSTRTAAPTTSSTQWRTGGGRAPIRREVDAYFRGTLRAFETPADLSAVGEGFTRRVLETVRTIPYGELWTYGDVAAAAGAARGRPRGGKRARALPDRAVRPVPPRGPRRAEPRQLRPSRRPATVPAAARGGSPRSYPASVRRWNG